MTAFLCTVASVTQNYAEKFAAIPGNGQRLVVGEPRMDAILSF